MKSFKPGDILIAKIPDNRAFSIPVGTICVFGAYNSLSKPGSDDCLFYERPDHLGLAKLAKLERQFTKFVPTKLEKLIYDI